MKVDRLSQGDVLRKRESSSRKKKVSLEHRGEFKEAVSFIEEIRRSTDREAHGDIYELMKEIERLGKKLVDEPDIEVAEEYKDAVSVFIDVVLKKIYRVRELNELRFTKSKVYLLVQKINSRLDELLSAVLREEKDRLLILSKVTEIRGMLIDLYR